ncbi:MAG: Rrf2 family transcriptional regulator [Bacteroidetes bacterium]|nr:Rrf2 family transcriptional regulator [Bacteroidota bacterium]MCL5737818.1 Rrf2 family transcriptional regulator [Bacteroidota bacterium]
MSLIFSRQCEYALQAVLYMSAQSEKRFTNINEISERLDIPMPFLGKTLQLLVRSKILSSQKGPKGGFKLAKNPSEIALFHIVDAIDGTYFMTSCVLGFPECSSKSPCPVHSEWGVLRDRVHQMLANRTIADISKEITDSKQLRAKLGLL